MKDEFVLDLRKTNGWPSEVEQRIGRSQEESMRSEEQVPKRPLGPSAGAPYRLRSMGSLFGRQQCTACKLEDATPSQVTTVETGWSSTSKRLMSYQPARTDLSPTRIAKRRPGSSFGDLGFVCDHLTCQTESLRKLSVLNLVTSLLTFMDHTSHRRSHL
jgi:hypothetical protein